MNFENFFKFTCSLADNTLQITVYEFLDNPTRFRARTNTLYRATDTQISHTPFNPEVDGQIYNRMKFYQTFERYTYRYKAHLYEIPVADDFNDNDRSTLATEYIKLAIKYHILPKHIGVKDFRYNETSDPMPESEVEQIKKNAIQRFKQSIGLLTSNE